MRVSCTVSEIWRIIGQIFGGDQEIFFDGRPFCVHKNDKARELWSVDRVMLGLWTHSVQDPPVTDFDTRWKPTCDFLLVNNIDLNRIEPFKVFAEYL